MFWPFEIDPDNLPEEMPEEMKAIIRKRMALMERHKAKHEQNQDALENLWSELSLKHLIVLRMLLHDFAISGENAATLASFYEGVCRTHLKLQHSVCPDCGGDHSEYEAMGLDPHTLEEKKASSLMKDIDTFMKEQSSAIPDPTFDNPDRTVKRDPDLEDFAKLIQANEPSPQRSLQKFTPEERAQMEEYGIDDFYDESTHAYLGLKCLNCKMPYVSIQDRMLQPPGVEGCSGCIQKAKWG